MLSNKHILLGITGGIAAYKAPLIARLLIQAGAEVQCVATASALQFVTPITLETVSGRPLYSDLFAAANPHSTEHISLKDWADLMLVAPATANIMGKMAGGIGDDALSTLLLALTGKPVVMCPAMNTQMWHNLAVQRTMTTLRGDGVHFIMPTSGELACGTTGMGRMEEPDAIVQQLQQLLQKEPPLLSGRHILVTAGPTYERIDAVRFIGNYSSGKMGFALAEALAQQGATVTLVAGPTHLATPPHDGIQRIDVESARQMYDACVQIFPSCDAAILSAAVADFRPEQACDIKIKKQNDHDGMTLTLVQNPDILATLGSMKSEKQRLVGFALETNNEEEHARRKLERKNLDFIVLNSLQDDGAGFGVDTNKVTLIDRDGTITVGQVKPKSQVARDIVAHLATLLPPKQA